MVRSVKKKLNVFHKYLSQTAHLRSAIVPEACLSPGGALNAYALSAYRVFLTAEPRRGSMMMQLLLAFIYKTHQFLPL